jgi:hypothetical protein
MIGKGWRPVGQAPVYHASVKDDEGLPTVVVAGPARDRVWLYVHATTVLRLHRPVVRFLFDTLHAVNDWFDRPQRERDGLAWTLPWDVLYPECVLIATHRRAWMHVFAASPSVVRLNKRTVQFLQYAVAELPAAATGSEAHRWTGQTTDIAAVPTGQIVAVAR